MRLHGVVWPYLSRIRHNMNKSHPESDQEDQLSSDVAYYDPRREVQRYRHWLPHWEQEGTLCFVTWRLADSLPRVLLERLSEEQHLWLKAHPEPWDERMQKEYHMRFTVSIENWLDRGKGSCLLRDQGNSRIVADALHYFDRKRYALDPFVIMPNHVHVIVQPGKYRMEQVIQLWKGYTAYQINKSLVRSGVLWHKDYWDRLIRDENHLMKCRAYIKENPVRAGLGEGEYLLECPVVVRQKG